jgi:hypothetical protein
MDQSTRAELDVLVARIGVLESEVFRLKRKVHDLESKRA